MAKQYYVYILSNKNQNVLYTGVTSNLVRRVYEHKTEIIEGFTKRYKLHNLVYFEIFYSAFEAIEREKQIKAMRRTKKNELIFGLNPGWKDLYDGL